MNSSQSQAFYDASSIHPAKLNGDLRIIAGLLITIAAVFIIVGLLKLLEGALPQEGFRIILYLISLSVILMIFFTFIA